MLGPNARLLLALTLCLAGCGGGSDPGDGGDPGLDAGPGAGMDAAAGGDDGGGAGDDGGGATDDAGSAGGDDAGSGGGDDAGSGGGGDGGSTASDAGGDTDACVPPVCAAPPDGCRYVNATRCSCGTLFCTTDCDGATCGGAEYCDYTSGCGGRGRCRTRPDFCAEIFDPVCGCDGLTYSNECSANSAGVPAAYAGECITGCRDDADCVSGETCQDCRTATGVARICLAAGTAC